MLFKTRLIKLAYHGLKQQYKRNKYKKQKYTEARMERKSLLVKRFLGDMVKYHAKAITSDADHAFNATNQGLNSKVDDFKGYTKSDVNLTDKTSEFIDYSQEAFEGINQIKGTNNRLNNTKNEENLDFKLDR